jgi:hypothetical protein
VKPIDKKCIKCDTLLTEDNWYESNKKYKIYYCQPCLRDYANVVANPKGNPQRMYVNGKYVPKSHPLYKAGRFKTFEGAAFSSLEGYANTTEGEVYVITNKAWKGWIKVGMAIDAEDRCKSYQTSSPLRDYELKYSQGFKDRRMAETTAHLLCDTVSKERQGEWFKMPVKKAVELIKNITKE